MTTFLRAVRKDRTEDVLEALQGNQDLNATDKKGVPVLHLAIENENLEIIELLLFPPGEENYPADPNSTDSDGTPALFKAVETGLLGAV